MYVYMYVTVTCIYMYPSYTCTCMYIPFSTFPHPKAS